MTDPPAASGPSFDQRSSGPLVIPATNWVRPDLQGYYSPLDPREPHIYQVYLPLSLFDLTDWVKLWGNNALDAYDWSEYRPDGIYPPIIVSIGCWKQPLIWVDDGNHRILKWQEYGFLLAPSWVLDYRAVQMEMKT